MKSMCSPVDALFSGGGVRPECVRNVCVDVASVPSSVRRRHKLFPSAVEETLSRLLLKEERVHDFQVVFLFFSPSFKGETLPRACQSVSLNIFGKNLPSGLSVKGPESLHILHYS